MTPEEFENCVARVTKMRMQWACEDGVKYGIIKDEDVRAAQIAILWATMELIEPNKAMLLKMIQGD